MRRVVVLALSTVSLIAGPARAEGPAPYSHLDVGSPRLSALALVPPPAPLLESGSPGTPRSSGEAITSLWRRGELVLVGTSSPTYLALEVTRGPRHQAPELALSAPLDALAREVGRPCAEAVRSLGRPQDLREGDRLLWLLEGRQTPWTLSVVGLVCQGDTVAAISIGWAANQDLRELVAASRRLPPPGADAERWPFGVVAGAGVGALVERWGPASHAACDGAPQPRCSFFWNPGVSITVDGTTGAVLGLGIRRPFDDGVPERDALARFVIDASDERRLTSVDPAWQEVTSIQAGGWWTRRYSTPGGVLVQVRGEIPWSPRPSILTFVSRSPLVVSEPERTEDRPAPATPTPRPPKKPFFTRAPEDWSVLGVNGREAARRRGVRGPALDLLGGPVVRFVDAFGAPRDVEVDKESLTLIWEGARGETLHVTFAGEAPHAIALQVVPSPEDDEQGGGDCPENDEGGDDCDTNDPREGDE